VRREPDANSQVENAVTVIRQANVPTSESVRKAFWRQQRLTYVVGVPFLTLLAVKTFLGEGIAGLLVVCVGIPAFYLFVISCMLLSDRYRNAHKPDNVLCRATGDWKQLPKFEGTLQWGKVQVTHESILWKSGPLRGTAGQQIPVDQIAAISCVRLKYALPLCGIVIDQHHGQRDVLLIRFPRRFLSCLESCFGG
jgi:hypothetical protein